MSLEGLMDSYTNLLRSKQSDVESMKEMESKNGEGDSMEYFSGSKAEETMEGVEEVEKEEECEVEGEGSLIADNIEEQNKGGAESLSFNDMDYLYPLHQGEFIICRICGCVLLSYVCACTQKDTCS